MLVRIIMGSSSDIKIAEKVTKILQKFDVAYEVSVISAHRDLDRLLEVVNKKDADLYIGIAGKAAHLSGVIAGATIRPVIGVPVKSSTLDGLDALLSTVQMPKGVPVATVAIDGGENAAFLAVQILATANKDLEDKLFKHKEEMKQGVLAMDQEEDIRNL